MRDEDWEAYRDGASGGPAIGAWGNLGKQHCLGKDIYTPSAPSEPISAPEYDRPDFSDYEGGGSARSSGGGSQSSKSSSSSGFLSTIVAIGIVIFLFW